MQFSEGIKSSFTIHSRIKKARRGEVMKKFVIPILKTIAIELLDAKKDDPMFSIKCLKCGCIRELEYNFSKRSGDIGVFNDENILNADEIIVSIQCNKCGNNLNSSEY